MADYYYLKGREGGYFDEQKEVLLDFIDNHRYVKTCFLFDSLNKLTDTSILGQALIKRWGEENFDRFKHARSIKINGKYFSYGTVRTLGYDLRNFDVIAHVYAYPDSILKPLSYTYVTDHIFLYWVYDQPELDQWMAILDGKKIREEEHIEPVHWNHLPGNALTELNRIKSVNISDGGTHPSDEKLIKDVVRK